MTTTATTADAPVGSAPGHPLLRHENNRHQRATRMICHAARNAAPTPQEPISGRRHVSEDDVSSLEVARQRRNVRALRAVVSSVHEDIGASQTRPARFKTSPRMPDFLTCKLHGQALAVMLCEDDGGGSSAFSPGPILMQRQWI